MVRHVPMVSALISVFVLPVLLVNTAQKVNVTSFGFHFSSDHQISLVSIIYITGRQLPFDIIVVSKRHLGTTLDIF